MTITLNAAISEYQNGSIEKSFEIAKMDDGLVIELTLDRWVTFAEQVIARRIAEDAMNAEILND